jgi:splicing suppressor protein 51
MTSGYTCLRCLAGPSSKSLSRRSLRNSRVPAEVQRWITSTSKPSTASITHPTQRHGSIQHRNISSPSFQSDHVVSDSMPVSGYSRFDPPPSTRALLKPNNLYHPFSSSPSPEIRRRAAFMRQHAYCPHPSHQQTRIALSPNDPEARKAANRSTLPPAHVKFECPDCGIPVSCSEEHWADDYESHLEICDTLRQINEDDHDLLSGRHFPEFDYPGPQYEEFLVNMMNWDTYLYSRQYTAINDPRAMRQVTRLLTYPVTIASVLHELSPYSIRGGGRLTVEGLKSLTGM